MSAVHEEKKPFECAVCNKGYNRKFDLKRHIPSYHKGKKPFRCEICDYSSSLKGSMNKPVGAGNEGKSHLNVTFVTTGNESHE